MNICLNWKKRAEAYSLIGNLLSLCELKTIDSDEINKKCEHLPYEYHKDLDYGDHLTECEHLKHYRILDENCETLLALYRTIFWTTWYLCFPMLKLHSCVHVFMCIMVINCPGERLFSRLKLILANQLRSTMRQQRLNWLSLMCMKYYIMKTIDFKPIIKQFSTKKFRKCMCWTLD